MSYYIYSSTFGRLYMKIIKSVAPWIAVAALIAATAILAFSKTSEQSCDPNLARQQYSDCVSANDARDGR